MSLLFVQIQNGTRVLVFDMVVKKTIEVESFKNETEINTSHCFCGLYQNVCLGKFSFPKPDWLKN